MGSALAAVIFAGLVLLFLLGRRFRPTPRRAGRSGRVHPAGTDAAYHGSSHDSSGSSGSSWWGGSSDGGSCSSDSGGGSWGGSSDSGSSSSC